ncbi:MAG: hypothetical protein GY703_18635 [Gammaproteobacteria bacterium]|nr:hypothetical protein [Gammaproteobacteria bacterium]
MSRSIIPENLSGREAMLIYDLLSAIQDEIWNHYETQLMEIIQAEYSIAPPEWGYAENSENLNDEIPF